MKKSTYFSLFFIFVFGSIHTISFAGVDPPTPTTGQMNLDVLACTNNTDSMPCGWGGCPPLPKGPTGGGNGGGDNGGNGGSQLPNGTGKVILQDSAGNPVSPGHTGIKYEYYNDITIPLSRGQSYVINRIYTTGAVPSWVLPAESSMLGRSWFLSCESRLIVPYLYGLWTSNVALITKDNRKRFFYGGVSDPGQGLLATVETSGTQEYAEYVITFRDKSKTVYYPKGLPKCDINPDGATIFYNWEQPELEFSRLLSMQTDEHGDPRYLSFEYNTSGRLTAIVLKNRNFANESQTIINYEYYPGDIISTSTLSSGLLESCGVPGKMQAVYRYGSYEPQNTTDPLGIVTPSYSIYAGKARTLASISYKNTETQAEYITSAYAYSSNGFNTYTDEGGNLTSGGGGWAHGGILKEYSRPTLVSGQSPLTSQLEVSYSFDLYPNDYFMVVYKGEKASSCASTTFSSDQSRFPNHIVHHSDNKDLSHLNAFRSWSTDGRSAAFGVPELIVFPNNSSTIKTPVDQNTESRYVISNNEAISAGSKYYLQKRAMDMNTTDVPYLSRYNVVFTQDETGRRTYKEYDNTWNLPTLVRDDSGKETRCEYHPNFGKPTKVTYPNGRIITQSYNSCGQVNTITDSWGRTITYGYANNGGGLLTSISDSQNTETLAVSYNFAGLPTQISSSYNNNVLAIEYNTNLKPSIIRLNSTQVLAQYTYDSSGKFSKVTDSNGKETTFTQDLWGRILTVTDSSSSVKEFKYDNDGNLTQFKDPQNGVTEYAYDIMGSVISETRKAQNSVNDKVTNYVLQDDCATCGGGAAGNAPVKITNPDGTYKIFEYDSRGRMTKQKIYSAAQVETRVIEFSYGLCRPVHVNNPFISSAQSPLRETDFVTAITDSGLPFSNKTMSFEYDNDGRVISMTHPDGYREEFWYDVKGRMSARRDVDGGMFRYSYNDQGYLADAMDAFGAVTGFVYNSGQSGQTGVMGSIQGLNYANGTKVRYGYNNLMQLTSLSHLNATNQAFETLNYTHDDAGRIKQISEAVSGYGWKYTYDDVYRLIKEQRYNTNTNLPVWDRGYSYNAAGDRTELTHFNGSTTNTVSYSYSEFRQLTSLFDSVLGPYTFTYDANGNRITKTNSASLNWDSDRRMVSVFNQTTYNYDHSGRRIYSTRNEGGSVPYRHFFSGLNEEIVKRGLTNSAEAFSFVEQQASAGSWMCPIGGSTTSAFDESLSRSVTQLTYPSWSGATFWSGTMDVRKRTVSFWIKRTDTGNNPALVGFFLNTSVGWRYVELVFNGGNDGLYNYGGDLYHQLFYGILPQDQWQRVEVDLGAIVARESGVGYIGTTAIYMRGVGFSMTPLRFSNSYTMTYNSLLPNALNPVASVRTHTSNGGKITASTSWLHYNHIGNVMGQSNAAGTGWTAQYMDAFGNAMTQAAANSTGAHTTPGTGALGITAKPYDAAAGAYYFYQRWYDPKVGAFTSWDPNPPFDQLPYGFVEGNPLRSVDSDGMQMDYDVSPASVAPCTLAPVSLPLDGALQAASRVAYILDIDGCDGGDKYKHCLLSCYLARGIGKFPTYVLANVKECSDYWRGYFKMLGYDGTFNSLDMAANEAGIFGDPKRSCLEICKGYKPCPQ